LLEAPLRQVFAKVRVENDGIGALEAERRWGALQINGEPLANCAYVTWSTGIGVGLCVDGHVLRGKNGNAGHAGHLFVSDNDDAQWLRQCWQRRKSGGGQRLCAPLQRSGLSGRGRARCSRQPTAGMRARGAIIDECCRVSGRTLQPDRDAGPATHQPRR
jgi:glucokinase